MCNELTLGLASGLILHMRVVPNGVDTTVFAAKNLQQRIVYGALLRRKDVKRNTEGGDRLFFGSAFLPVTTPEANVVMSFIDAAGLRA